jgi:transposase
VGKTWKRSAARRSGQPSSTAQRARRRRPVSVRGALRWGTRAFLVAGADVAIHTRPEGPPHYLRSLYPPQFRIAIVCDNFSPLLTTKKCQRVGTWATANNLEIAYTPTNSSWLNRIEAQFTALCYFTLDGTDHASHKEQGSMIRRYIIWRNGHADDQRLRAVVDRANAA